MYLLSRRVGIVLLAVLGLLVLLVVGHGLFFAQQSGFFPDWVGLTPDEGEISYRIIG